MPYAYNRVWKDISSAPRDRDFLAAAEGEGHRALTYAKGHRMRWVGGAFSQFVAFADRDLSMSTQRLRGTWHTPPFFKPTHWAELPGDGDEKWFLRPI